MMFKLIYGKNGVKNLKRYQGILIILYNQYIRKIFLLSVLVINSDLVRLTESYFHQTEIKKEFVYLLLQLFVTNVQSIKLSNLSVAFLMEVAYPP